MTTRRAYKCRGRGSPPSSPCTRRLPSRRACGPYSHYSHNSQAPACTKGRYSWPRTRRSMFESWAARGGDRRRVPRQRGGRGRAPRRRCSNTCPGRCPRSFPPWGRRQKAWGRGVVLSAPVVAAASGRRGSGEADGEGTVHTSVGTLGPGGLRLSAGVDTFIHAQPAALQ